jgi:acyl-coenzyme A thioesterase PaaI-like protein
VTNDPSARERAASVLRALGHEFVGRNLTDEQLEAVTVAAESLLATCKEAPERTRSLAAGSMSEFAALIPDLGKTGSQLFLSDSIVAGGANPMGLGAHLFKDGDRAVMEVTLGKAFEGAPGRAHGGIVAALIDETIGMVLTIQGVLCLTAKLALDYRAPTPINRAVTTRAWIEQREGRKLHMRAELVADGTVCVEATGLFIEIDPTRFRSSAEG